jgi:alkylglycerol monooxygenase
MEHIRLVTYGIPPAEFKYARLLSKAPGIEELIASDAIPAYTLQAIPVFFALFVLEFLVGLARGRKVYRLNDFFTSVLSGSVMLVVNSFLKVMQMSAYAYIYANFRLVDLEPESWAMWLGLFLSIDCGYYWMHRSAHTYHLLWSAHSVHHSGEDYNLATALRQGALQGAYSWAFYLPLALFFHPGCYLGHAALNTLGQFWIHTTVCGSLGPLEYVLNTPSHHRMHHRPPGNCNYAAILIIWDRMFGTFVSEREQQEYYGLAKAHQSFDPVWANLEHFTRMVADGDLKRFFFRKRVVHPLVFQPLKVFERFPTRKVSLWKMPQAKDKVRDKYDPVIGTVATVYACVMFLCTLGGALLFLLRSKAFSVPLKVAWGLLLLFSLSQLGKVLDGKSGSSSAFVALEAARVAVFGYAVSTII